MTTLLMLLIALVYLDFSIWYHSEMANIFSKKKCKYRGILAKLWDRWGGET